ncbi:glycosyltransferase family 4 protein [Candidatus Uhrbacteria bacterium]|nr:glycosyltransferase family 4 protein [Candidatus Uhrbacteria bacterium]
MIIGIDCNALTRGGATGVERYVRTLVMEMMKVPLAAGDRVLLYASEVPSTIPHPLPPGFAWRVLPFALPKGWTHIRLSWELLRNPPDVLFVPGHEVPRYVGKKTKVVTTVHDVAFRRVPTAYPPSARRRQEWAVRRAAKVARRIIAISETTKHDLVELYGVPADRIAVTPLAVDTAPFAMTEGAMRDVLQKYRLAPQRYFFYVGRLEEKKNIVSLVRAFAELKRQLGIGHPVELILAGTFGFGKERIMRAVGAANDVRTLGYVPDADAAALTRGALALCLPSLYEGFGLPILEGFAAHVPVIASDIPSSREVAEDASLFVEPTDVPGWVRAMQRCLFEADLRASLAAKGDERLRAFSWGDTAAKTWQALRSV